MRLRVAVIFGSFLAAMPAARAAAPFAKKDLYRIGRQSSLSGDFARAAAAFEDMLRGEAGRHAIQLAVVCERETIARLVDAGESEDGFFFLSASVSGKECYKALWGAYGTADAARAALATVPSTMKDAKNPPVVVAVDALLGVPPPGPRPVPAPAGDGRRSSAAASPGGPKVFTDNDLSGYRKKREEEERRYGVPKPLFEEEDLRKPAGKAAKPAPRTEPPKTTVATSPEPGAGEKGYWTALFGSAKATVDQKRKALAAAEKSGAGVDAARQELQRAEQALEDLRARAKAKGADPAWMQ